MAKNNRPQNQQEQKVVTKYDKKVQKRKEAQRKAERDKKNNRICLHCGGSGNYRDSSVCCSIQLYKGA